MRQYRITSADFVTPGDTGEPDAFMDEAELAQLKKLAGTSTFTQTVVNNPLPNITQKTLREQKFNE